MSGASQQSLLGDEEKNQNQESTSKGSFSYNRVVSSVLFFSLILCLFNFGNYIHDISTFKDNYLHSLNPSYFVSDLKHCAKATVILSAFAIAFLILLILLDNPLILLISSVLIVPLILGIIISEVFFYKNAKKNLSPLVSPDTNQGLSIPPELRHSKSIEKYVTKSLQKLYEQAKTNFLQQDNTREYALRMLTWEQIENDYIGKPYDENKTFYYQYSNIWKGYSNSLDYSIPNASILYLDTENSRQFIRATIDADGIPQTVTVASLNFNNTKGYKAKRRFCWAVNNRQSFKCAKYSKKHQPNQPLSINSDSSINTYIVSGPELTMSQLPVDLQLDLYHIEDFPIAFYLLSLTEIQDQNAILNLPDQGLSSQAYFYTDFNNKYGHLSTESLKQYGKIDEKKEGQCFWCHVKPTSYDDAYYYVPNAFEGFSTDLDLTANAKCSSVPHYFNLSLLDTAAPFQNVGKYPRWYEKALGENAEDKIFHPDNSEAYLAQFAIINIIIQSVTLILLVLSMFSVLAVIIAGLFLSKSNNDNNNDDNKQENTQEDPEIPQETQEDKQETQDIQDTPQETQETTQTTEDNPPE